MKSVLVSVIVPVYNVEKYLEKCLTSLASQTYKNLEIILIDDGSTDKSGEICRSWSKKEKFIYLSKKNEGMGFTRNLGLDMAKGDYVMFVDSDDWISKNAIEQLVKFVNSSNLIDVVATSRYFQYNEQSRMISEIKEKFSLQAVKTELERRIYLMYGFVMVWGKLFRKQFLLENQIKMPPIPYEDNAVFPQIVFLADEIKNCDIPIYYYRVNREGSIISNIHNRIYMADACEHILKSLIQKDMLELHYAGIKRYVESRLKYSYDLYYQNVSDIEKQKRLKEKIQSIHEKYFPMQKPYWLYQFHLLGGFGSRTVVQRLGENAKQLKMHLPFTSLIAQMTPANSEEYIIDNENEFRVKAIKRDIDGELYHSLQGEKMETDFFFIDFLEERYDVAELDDGNYITLSEAYTDSIVSNIRIKRIFFWNSKERMELWKQKCRKFIELLKGKYEDEKVVLIKAKLACNYLIDDEWKRHENIDYIMEMNVRLEEMYDYFEYLFDGNIQKYDYQNDIYSEKISKYGIGPQYFADEIYQEISERIKVSFDCRTLGGIQHED